MRERACKHRPSPVEIKGLRREALLLSTDDEDDRADDPQHDQHGEERGLSHGLGLPASRWSETPGGWATRALNAAPVRPPHYALPMKTCPNCRVVHDDEYNGTCHECGKPLGGVQANGGSNLSFAFARQIQDGARESAQEQAMKSGRYDGVKVDPALLNVARSFIVIDHEKLREAE